MDNFEKIYLDKGWGNCNNETLSGSGSTLEINKYRNIFLYNFINENNIYSNPWISYNLLLSLLFTFLTSTFSSIFMICSMSILHLNVPDKLRGRVMGIHTITFSLMSVGALILGLLAEFFGSSIAVMSTSTLLIIINLYIFISKKEIRNI